MKLLAIDTSTKYFCIGIYDKGRIAGYRIEAGRRLSDWITPTLDRVVAAAGLDYADFTCFACGLGPGSFTGMRIGMAAIKAMAWACKKPVAGVSTLEVLARGIPDDGARLYPVIDARRTLIYSCCYSKKGDRLKLRKRVQLCSIKEILRDAKTGSIFFGDALAVYTDELVRGASCASLMEHDYWYPQPQYLIEAAMAAVKAGKTMTAHDIEPTYVYPKDCQIRKTSRLTAPGKRRQR